MAGCEPTRRQKILTFFFDGVNPDGSEQDRQGGAQSTRQGAGAGKSGPEKQVWWVHEPAKSRKTCPECHGEWGDKGTAASANLIAPVPKLCFLCHDDFMAPQVYVHGPVATGDCLACHHQHRSKVAGLLKNTEPDICYECHEDLEANPIPEHPSDPEQQCTKCHDPHGGSDRFFLTQ